MKIKNSFKILGLLLLLTIIYYLWYVYYNFRFEEISHNKVYKSALIKPERIESFLISNNIKTVINLLDSGIQDTLNPAKQDEIDAEDKAINNINEKYNKSIKHVNIPSSQIPTKNTLTQFYNVLDDQSNYPVLIHCYHGTGRAEMYSALYRIEYENWKNDDARAKTRILVKGLGYTSSFAKGKEKGDFLINYKPRRIGKNSTLNQMRK